MSHTNSVHKLMIELSKNPNIRVWKNQVGIAKSFDGERVIAFGLPGAGDITGIIKCKSGAGIRLEIDWKEKKDVLSKDQISFQGMILKMGGLYVESRKVEETIKIIENFINSH